MQISNKAINKWAWHVLLAFVLTLILQESLTMWLHLCSDKTMPNYEKWSHTTKTLPLRNFDLLCFFFNFKIQIHLIFNSFCIAIYKVNLINKIFLREKKILFWSGYSIRKSNLYFICLWKCSVIPLWIRNISYIQNIVSLHYDCLAQLLPRVCHSFICIHIKMFWESV